MVGGGASGVLPLHERGGVAVLVMLKGVAQHVLGYV